MVEETRGELDELQSRVLEIQALLKKRAPVLGPRVVPKQLRGACNLFQICSTVKQRADAEAFLASKAPELAVAAAAAAAGPAPAEENEEKDPQEENEGSGDQVVVLETETDIAARQFRVTAAKFGGAIDATLRDLDLLMELHLNAGRDELEPYVARFAAANGFDFSGRTAASALQEVCSLAYALQVSASNIGGWTGFVGSFQLPLAEDVEMAAVLHELFALPAPPPASPPSGSRGKSKGKGRNAKKKKAAAAAVEGAKPAGSEGKEKRGKSPAKASKRKR